mmetsp:Transcript_27718/g.52018  ORF Transcript_27718/g.52018 Transcript_27718/m.52018 type:complete len:105 (-) Transcript_27718:216-530(-)
MESNLEDEESSLFSAPSPDISELIPQGPYPFLPRSVICLTSTPFERIGRDRPARRSDLIEYVAYRRRLLFLQASAVILNPRYRSWVRCSRRHIVNHTHYFGRNP